MGDWYDLLQPILIGLLFSYLLAKLISVIVAFKEGNLSVTRGGDSSPAKLKSTTGEYSRGEGSSGQCVADSESIRERSVTRDAARDASEKDEDEDWEGVESTELDEAFSAASIFVATAAADRLSAKVSSDTQLQLYGLYKIATEGPCSTPQPSALKMAARAKWQAWQKLGAMPPEEAMQKYVDIVTELYPNWVAGAAAKGKNQDENAPNNGSKSSMGPVFSSFVHEEESEIELKMDAIHGFAREGEVGNLLECIEIGAPVNVRDGEGRTPLHWAVDRGHQEVAELLVRKNADIDAKDNEGQTPLHYAATCDRESIAKFLVKANADVNIKDADGDSPADLCESDWRWLKDLTKPKG